MPHLENNLFFYAFLLYLLSSVVYLAVFWFRAERAYRLALVIFAVALILHTAALLVRSIEGSRMPFASMYEFILVFSWGTAALYLFGCWKYKIHITGVLVLPLEILFLGYALTVKTEAQPLVPALQSIWLQLHVAAAVFAYGLFALSFAASALYLIFQKGKDDYFIAARSLDKLIYYFIAAGFPFMTLVIITGAIWAEEAWGTWWNWDPKETWALVTWLIYALYLHFRRTKQWSGRAAAWVALAGFIAVIFTLFGVTLLMPGAHSY
ncbi:c-type cytochrome biogenesis protein CcsB [Pelotomaculum propionicicum]|uniref:c-type cytochrome biogenesis protein CcsB n=1 Tax=Pelotomaculum propionicicum TaxID=258475 RepID=UPI003B7723DD